MLYTAFDVPLEWYFPTFHQSTLVFERLSDYGSNEQIFTPNVHAIFEMLASLPMSKDASFTVVCHMTILLYHQFTHSIDLFGTTDFDDLHDSSDRTSTTIKLLYQFLQCCRDGALVA
ncbi:hypothetical protein NPIL_319641 [Nephila pilipes]|uniref:Uncharacterized protein n=1 Tax=Nephila pilipes TaxID=299642 RepID=A0A8X6PPM7_NEPPI|nr:hypothetical protein NPIL_319641 [Nephila pilipes]